MKKGFTLVEMLAVIALVGLLAVIGVATYTNVNESAKQKTLEAKKEHIRAAAIKWAKENNITSKTVISVNALVVEGYLTADENRVDDIGLIENPVTGENMICNTVDISFKQSETVAEVNDTVQNCDLATQSLVDTKINIQVIDADGHNKTGGTNSSISNWTNKNVIVVVSSSDYDRDVVSISFDFEGNTTTKQVSGLNKYTGTSYLDSDQAKSYYNVFNIDANLLLNNKVVVSYSLTNGQVKSRAYTVRIDKEEATASVKSNNEWLTTDKPIYVLVDDGKGSGPRYFYVTTADNSPLNDSNKYDANNFEGTATDLEVGKYFIWTEDNAGNRSVKPKMILEINNVDKTIPECEVVFDGTLGDHGWYKKDEVKTYGHNTVPAGISGVNIGVNQSEDTPVYTAYAYYGTDNYGQGETRTTDTLKGGELYWCHAKTLAGNYAQNSLRLFLDRTPPTISISVTEPNTHTQTKTVSITIQDVLSGLNARTNFRYGFSLSNTTPPSVWHDFSITATEQTNDPVTGSFTTTDLITGTYYLWIDTSGLTDYAGNYAEPPAGSNGNLFKYGTFKFDNTPPQCTSNNGKTNWTTGSYNIRQYCGDAEGTTDQSGCTQASWLIPYTVLNNVWSDSVVIRDKAGNTRTCTYNVYLDNDLPTCNGNNGKSNWTNGTWTGNQYCKDDYSGCSQNPFTNTWRSSTDQSSITISDNVGHTRSCGISVRLDTNAPTCRSVASPDDWTNQNVSIYGYCSDTGGSGCKTQGHNYGGVNYSGTYAMNQYSIEQDAYHNPGYVYDNAGNRGDCADVRVRIDHMPPSCGTLSYGSDSTSGVSVSITCTDPQSSGVSSGCSRRSFSGGTSTGPGSITISDNAGNTQKCDYTVSSYTQHRTRGWNTCASGNDCVAGYDYNGTSCTQGCSSGTFQANCESSTGSTCCCKVYNSCKSRTPCVGDWDPWGGWSNGACLDSYTGATVDCQERTMYHGG